MQTIAGLIPLLPAVALPPRAVAGRERLGKRFARLRDGLDGDRRNPRSAASDELGERADACSSR